MMMSHEISGTPTRNAQYLGTLRPLLPAHVFRPYTRAYVDILGHLALVIAGLLACKYLVASAWWPLIGLAISVGLSSLAFLAHDLTHRSIVRKSWLLYPTELLLWALMFMPATLYRRVHLAHHAHTNGDLDPDRRFLASETSRGARLAAALLFPNKESRFSVLCRFYWAFFPIRNLIVMSYPGVSKPGFATAKVMLPRHDKLWITFEVAFIAGLHAGLILFLHRAYWWAVLLPSAINSLVTSWYLFTNHGEHRIGDGTDILGATTSVCVSRICDRLHSNFSYHVEHHLFPSVNPHYYPMISELLQQHFPNDYKRSPMRAVWKRLWQNSAVAEHT